MSASPRIWGIWGASGASAPSFPTIRKSTDDIFFIEYVAILCELCGLFRQMNNATESLRAVVAVLRVRASWLSRHARSLPLRVRAHAARRAPTDRPCVTALSSARSHVTTLARRARASRAFSAFRVRSHSVVAHRGATCSTLRSSSAAPWRLVSRSTRSTRRSGGGARVDRLRGAAARRARRRAHRDRRLTPVTTRCCTSVRCVVCWRMLPYLGIFVHIGIFVCVRDIHILLPGEVI